MARIRKIVPTAAAVEIAVQKLDYGNKSKVVPVGGGSEVFFKPKGAGRAGSGGIIVVRGTHVKSAHNLGNKAKALKACKGKKGSEFKGCVATALGGTPRSLNNY